jgi:hypothetical protein
MSTTPGRNYLETKLSPEEWFLKNPPQEWRNIDGPIAYYTKKCSFELVSRSPAVDMAPDFQYALLKGSSRYTPGRYMLRVVLPWTIFTLGAATLFFWAFVWHYLWRVSNEELPQIRIFFDREGSGRFLEERTKVSAFGLEVPMVHPKTGQTGWTGVPESYYQNVT